MQRVTRGVAMSAAVCILVLAVSGCGSDGGSQASASESCAKSASDVGCSNMSPGYILPSRLEQVISENVLFYAGNADETNVSISQCRYGAPGMGDPPVITCQVKMGPEWHDNVQCTGRPDGSVSCEDDTSTLINPDNSWGDFAFDSSGQPEGT